jgi:hypothetical protein
MNLNRPSVKTSARPAATSLGSSDLLPIEQGGVPKHIAVSRLEIADYLLKTRISTLSGEGKYEVLSDFSTTTGFTLGRQASGTGDTLTLETTIKKIGSGSLKVQIPTNGTYWGELTLPAFSQPIYSAAGVGAWVYIPDHTKVFSIVLYLSKDAGYANYGTFTYRVMETGGNANRFDGWHFIGFDNTELALDWTITGSLTWGDTFTTSKFRVNPAAGTNGAIVYFDSLLVNFKGRAKIVIVADDGADSWYNSGISYLNTKGIPCTMAIIGEKIGLAGYMTLSQLRTAYESGHDLVTHGLTSLTTLTAGQQESDITANRAYLANNGFIRNNGYLHYVYPSGTYDMSIIALLKSLGFLTARGIHKNVAVQPGFGLGDRAYMYNILGGESTETAQQLKDRIDLCCTNGSTGVFMFHNLVAGAPGAAIQYNIDDFKTVIDHIALRKDQGACDVLTVPQWYNGITR